jgi:hypothetical protein
MLIWIDPTFLFGAVCRRSHILIVLVQNGVIAVPLEKVDSNKHGAFVESYLYHIVDPGRVCESIHTLTAPCTWNLNGACFEVHAFAVPLLQDYSHIALRIFLVPVSKQ